MQKQISNRHRLIVPLVGTANQSNCHYCHRCKHQIIYKPKLIHWWPKVLIAVHHPSIWQTIVAAIAASTAIHQLIQMVHRILHSPMTNYITVWIWMQLHGRPATMFSSDRKHSAIAVSHRQYRHLVRYVSHASVIVTFNWHSKIARIWRTRPWRYIPILVTMIRVFKHRYTIFFFDHALMGPSYT